MMGKRCIVIAISLILTISFMLGHARAGDDDGGLAPDPAAYVSPSRDFDALHTRLDLDLDLEGQTIAGAVTHRIVALKPAITEVRLNCVDLVVDGVTVDGYEAGFSHPVAGWHATSWIEIRDTQRATDQLVVRLNQPVALDDTLEVTVRYHGAPRQGLYFIAPERGLPDRRLEVWSQGEGEDNRYWIPCFDYPNDKASFEGIFRVPEGMYVLSNGNLLDRRPADGKTQYHWRLDEPQVSYLMMVAAGRYEVFEERWREVPLLYVVPPGTDRETVRRGYGRTADMMSFFSDYTAIDYPFGKYAQVVVQDFIYGGMENTTATVMHQRTLFDERSALTRNEDGLVAHELAHQWWGDMVTCAEWSHLWLNEGFATYFQALYREHADGDAWFRYEMDGRHRSVVSRDARDARPMVVDFFNRRDGRNSANVYTKGSSVLHMLRFLIGDELFRRVIRRYGERFMHDTARTSDFAQVVRETTGENLDWFFEQWAYLAGHPELAVSKQWNDKTKTLELKIEQTQDVGGLTPLFRLPMDVEITAGQDVKLRRIEVSAEKQTFHFPLSKAPDMVIVDKGDWTLKKMTFPKGTDELLHQLREGDAMSRVRAARALSKRTPGRNVVDALSTVVADGSVFWGVRREAALALGQLDDDRSRGRLITLLGVENARVRLAVVEAMGKQPTGRDIDDALRDRLRKDRAYEIQAQAVTSLVAREAPSAEAACIEALGMPSHQDMIRRAALQGLAKLESTNRLDRVFEMARAGQPRTYRHQAIATYATLAKQLDAARHREQASRRLESMLDDSYLNTRIAAARALGTLGENRALPALERVADTDPVSRVRSAARRAADRLRETTEDREARRRTRQEMESEVERLGLEIEALKRELGRHRHDEAPHDAGRTEEDVE